MSDRKIQIHANGNNRLPELQSNGVYNLYAPHELAIEQGATLIVKFGWKMLLPEGTTLILYGSDLVDSRNIRPLLCSTAYVNDRSNNPFEFNITLENAGLVRHVIKMNELICKFGLVKLETVPIVSVDKFIVIVPTTRSTIDPVSSTISEIPKDFVNKPIDSLNLLELDIKYEERIKQIKQDEGYPNRVPFAKRREFASKIWDILDQADKEAIIKLETDKITNDDMPDEFRVDAISALKKVKLNEKYTGFVDQILKDRNLKLYRDDNKSLLADLLWNHMSNPDKTTIVNTYPKVVKPRNQKKATADHEEFEEDSMEPSEKPKKSKSTTDNEVEGEDDILDE